MKQTNIRVFFASLLLAALLPAQSAPPAAAQSPSAPGGGRATRGGGSVQGSVKDQTGGVIPGATVTLMNGSTTTATTQTGSDGSFTFRGVAPGTYSLLVTYTGMQQASTSLVSVTAGQAATANLAMTVKTEKQEVTVNDSTNNVISTEPANNATALVLQKEDLDALPDDPDDLQADLQALAGPSAGPGGNQIFVDGFSNGRLPPKESIREIRINSNPFSAEFDKLGYGRIQIFTKPGSDKFHGGGYYNISDGIWDSRNPFLTVNPPFRTQLFGGNVSGPIGKKASFFIDTERRNIDDNGIITANIPTSNLLGSTSYQNFFPTPQRRTTVSPRVDIALNASNTLSARYSWLGNDRKVAGIGSFDLPALTVGNITLPSSGYSSNTTEQDVQVVETAVLSPKLVNEIHFQFDRTNLAEASQSSLPELMVAQSFTSGGSGYSAPGYASTYNLTNNYEFQDYASLTWKAHTTKVGIRIRSSVLDNSSPQNFNGVYQFLGGTFPYLGAALQPNLVPNAGSNTVSLTSIQQYIYTLALLNSGIASAAVTAMGYGPSKYTANFGNPYFGLSQTDIGPFIQDDWKVRQNLTVSLGLRFESQTNIHDHSDFAPRVGFAYAIGNTPKTKLVIRGGWGIFYDRFAVTNVEQAERYQQGGALSTYTVDGANITNYNAEFSTAQSLASLSATSSSSQKYQIDSALRAPYLMQTALGVEKQLLAHTTLGLNFLNARGVHELRTVDINAPIPVVGQLPPGATTDTATAITSRPYAALFNGDIYDYQSTGTFKQTQVLVNVNSQVGRWLTLFSRYSYSNAHSDTDGLGTLPSDPYNLRQDWGRSSLDIKSTVFVGGSIVAKYGIRFSPFMVIRSGVPYNITTGTDLYLQGTGTPTARPSLSATPTKYYLPGYGYLNPDPLVGEPEIERNAVYGPGSISINLRVSRTWGFGTTKFEGSSGGAHAGGGGGGGGRGGPGGGGGFGGGGPRGGPGGGESTSHRYNLTLGINARNLINHENLNTPNGSITSPYFLESTGISGGFGPESTASNQRRIDLQLRFAF
jgi:hypothetical protein